MNDRQKLRQNAKAECNFGEVPKSELESCVWYEYLRESKEHISEVQAIRRQMAIEAKKRGAPIGVSSGLRLTVNALPGCAFDAAMLVLLADIPGFPDVSWQMLPDKDKDKARKLANSAQRSERKLWLKKFPPLIIETRAENPSLGGMTLNEWRHDKEARYKTIKSQQNTEAALVLAPKSLFSTCLPYGKHFVSGFFIANLNLPPSDLQNAFKVWLKANHPNMREPARRPAGRKDIPSDVLNALGSMRLRYICNTPEEANTLKAHAIQYANTFCMNRSCENAVTYFRNLLKLPKDCLPIHYRRNWRGHGKK